jgi:hypothetical protein
MNDPVLNRDRSGLARFNHIAHPQGYTCREPEPTAASIDKDKVSPFSDGELSVLFKSKSEKGMRCGIKLPNPQLPPQL